MENILRSTPNLLRLPQEIRVQTIEHVLQDYIPSSFKHPPIAGIRRPRLAMQSTPHKFKDGGILNTCHQLRHDLLSILQRQKLPLIFNVVLYHPSIHQLAWLVLPLPPSPRSNLAREGFPGIFVNVYFAEDAEVEWNCSNPSEDIYQGCLRQVVHLVVPICMLLLGVTIERLHIHLDLNHDEIGTGTTSTADRQSSSLEF